jgi:hypothetical protein
MQPYVEFEEVQELFGIDFFGPETVAEILGGADLFGPAVPRYLYRQFLRVPFSRDELQRAKYLGMIIVLRISHDKYGNGLTIRYLRDLAARSRAFRLVHAQVISAFGDIRETPWYASEAFARNEVPRPGWSLVQIGAVPRSLGRTWKDQNDDLKRWTEGNAIRFDIARRRTAVEAVYDSLLYWQRNRQFKMDMVYDWTATTSSDGWLVFVGCHNSRLWIDALLGDAQDPCVGVCPSLFGLDGVMLSQEI